MAMDGKQAVLTREQVKKEKVKGQQQEREKIRVRVRLIPIWLRLLMVIALFALSIVVGAIVGYGVLGNGDPMDVFEKSTWTHVMDLIQK
ncbi:DNA-directed RNA polymerase subunit beta [Mesobacillus maritimus]|uniref:DNA-directed RNA polymerase subunit beta n=1 Tax=Mesobacillus maritimus TaxID=1643336 RepID=A0ABS7K538_9BACI|nr:DNA-directed RNA polymerase subunit beta [Mesobacillus maritimus]MBY0097376.1 DNA-directed RNA polymerase subunit beta [Mesobacillus maritimus]